MAGQLKLIEDDDFRLLLDPAGSVSVSGVDYRLLGPDGTTLLKNSGSIQFTPSDGLSWNGPHPGISGVSTCAAHSLREHD